MKTGVRGLLIAELQPALHRQVQQRRPDDYGGLGQLRPGATSLSYHVCTDDLGLDDRATPTFSYLFPLTFLGSEGSAFGEKATAVWKSLGMKITEADNPGILNRFAVSDDGFRFSITVNQEANQVYIGGSGPCVPCVSAGRSVVRQLREKTASIRISDHGLPVRWQTGPVVHDRLRDINQLPGLR